MERYDTWNSRGENPSGKIWQPNEALRVRLMAGGRSHFIYLASPEENVESVGTRKMGDTCWLSHSHEKIEVN